MAFLVLLILAVLISGCGPGEDKKKTTAAGSATTATQTRSPITTAAIDDGEGERYLRVEERLRRRQQRILDELNRPSTASQQ